MTDFCRLSQFPGVRAMESWKLPPGTLIEVVTQTVIYPDGWTETWAEVEAKHRQPRKREAAQAPDIPPPPYEQP